MENHALLKDTDISPTTDVCPHVAEYSAENPHLTAPSAGHLTTCFLPDSHLAQVLCKGIIAVISASTVCLYYFFHIIAPIKQFVNTVNHIFLILMKYL